LVEARAEVKAIADEMNHCFFADSGSCGDFLYVRVGDGFVSSTRYFDQTGKLVGAVGTTDVVSPPCEGITVYGREIKCRSVVQESYCRSPALSYGR